MAARRHRKRVAPSGRSHRLLISLVLVWALGLSFVGIVVGFVIARKSTTREQRRATVQRLAEEEKRRDADAATTRPDRIESELPFQMPTLQPERVTANPDVFLAANGRSPIPQPDEAFEGPIRMEDVEITTAHVPEPVVDKWVSWEDAGKYAGREITVKGRVVETRNTGEVCFLNFVTPWQGTFYVIIFNDAFDSWDEPPEEVFRDRTILVAGTVKRYKDRPQIKVRDARQIVIVDESLERGAEGASAE
ncbi:MAG: hypothetical protein CMJ18_27625 [Phycisphaeraceae bacterium]|nr:hypothetical protein [Phycisphaeraceae bacterium]